MTSKLSSDCHSLDSILEKSKYTLCVKNRNHIYIDSVCENTSSDVNLFTLFLLKAPATAHVTSAESNSSVDKLGSSKVITRTKLSCACLIYVAGTMFDFFGLIFRKTFTHVLNSSHLRLLRLLQTHQSQQTSLLKSAAVPR